MRQLLGMGDPGGGNADAGVSGVGGRGVLVEMLCSGVPGIVPAGCWLAEEIAESIYQHLDQLSEHVPAVAR